MSGVWSMRLSAGQMQPVYLSKDLRITNFALGVDVKDGRSVVQLCFERADHERIEVVPICVLTPYKNEHFSTCIELNAGTEYAFEVVGVNDVHLIGNYIGGNPTFPQVASFDAEKSLETSSILASQTPALNSPRETSLSINAFTDSKVKHPLKMDGRPDLMPNRIITEEIVGPGEPVVHGSRVVLWYMCKLHPGDFVLDRSTTADGPPVELTVGSGQIPHVWDQSLIGMNVGGNRVIDIPPHLINMDEWKKHLTWQDCHEGLQRLSEVNPQEARIIVRTSVF